jgi:hypothetical protein
VAPVEYSIVCTDARACQSTHYRCCRFRLGILYEVHAHRIVRSLAAANINNPIVESLTISQHRGGLHPTRA